MCLCVTCDHSRLDDPGRGLDEGDVCATLSATILRRRAVYGR